MPTQNPPASRRIVVTGLGAVSPWGWDLASFRAGILSGKTAIGPFRRFDHSRQRTHIAGEVPPAPPQVKGRLRGFGRLSHADAYALAAAQEALSHAGLLPGGPGVAGVYFGGSTGGLLESEWYYERQLKGQDPSRRLLASQQLSAPGDAVARYAQTRGPIETVSSACASGGLALEAALRDLASGEAEWALAGGSDSLSQITYSGFNALRAVSEIPCRPFRADRTGMSIGEGAGVMVLEPLERALARGAQPLAELRGAGSSCDASHMTAPHPEGLGAALAIERALKDAGLEPQDIDFVNAHGTGTPLNDVAEWAALRKALGERAGRIPLTSTKGVIGHLLGSSGAIEAVATVLCLRELRVHPTPGDGPVDPAAPVDLVLDQPRSLPDARFALSTSLAFGGANAAVIFARWPESNS